MVFFWKLNLINLSFFSSVLLFLRCRTFSSGTDVWRRLWAHASSAFVQGFFSYLFLCIIYTNKRHFHWLWIHLVSVPTTTASETLNQRNRNSSYRCYCYCFCCWGKKKHLFSRSFFLFPRKLNIDWKHFLVFLFKKCSQREKFLSNKHFLLLFSSFYPFHRQFFFALLSYKTLVDAPLTPDFDECWWFLPPSPGWFWFCSSPWSISADAAFMVSGVF